jgi:hypothetical protein
MNKRILIIIALVISSQLSQATDSTSNSPNPSSKTESTVKAETKKGKETTKAETTPKKKKSFFAIFDIVGRMKEFVSGKSKQNEKAIVDAENGVFQPTTKRALASDPKTRAIQEKLDKLQADRLKKYESD